MEQSRNDDDDASFLPMFQIAEGRLVSRWQMDSSTEIGRMEGRKKIDFALANGFNYGDK